MSDKFEIRGTLARLLATEDLIVEHKKVDTACFNVHTRCLTLPLWEKASDSVYNMLVLHEISHSLWTPNIDWSKNHKIPQQFINVCEDVRVEKLCKRKYPGSPKSFYAGYKELAEQDFFLIDDTDLETYNLADRVNLYFKIGNYVDVPIQVGEETEIANLIANAETFDDVLIAAKVLYEYCKQKQQEEIESSPDSQETSQSGASDAMNQDEGGGEESENEEPGETDSYGGTAQQDQSTQSQGGQQGSEKAEPEVKTMDSLEESLKDLIGDSGAESVYLELPQLDLKRVIVPNAEIHSKCKENWSSYLEHYEYQYSDIFGEVDRKFVDFKRSAQKEVNYLVKEFECRKAADSYARSTTARTGVLDCSRIHSYKYSEDLFKKITTLADGKNHGLVFVLDWSGSMASVMSDTVKQLFNLIWFCKKVAIPFEVYAFTHDYPLISYDAEGKSNIRKLSYQKKDNLIRVEEHFSMMNLLTSKVNNKTLDEQMKNIFRLAHHFQESYSCKYNVPMGLSLSGTPLNEALISLHQILPQFQKQNKLQKVQCVILTDGEANAPKYHHEFIRKWEENPYMGTCSIGPNSFLRDRKTGNTYSLGSSWWKFTDVILHNLRDTFVNTNFIGIRVIESRDAGNFIRRYCGYSGSDYDDVMNSWKKEKSFTLKTSGYHAYFGISSTSISQDTEFSVSEDASKSQIKTAFVKSLKSKKMNRRILGEFVSLVA
jgi:hypothetical protein